MCLGYQFGLNRMKIDTHTHIWDNKDYIKEVTRYKPSYSFSEKQLSDIFCKYDVKKAVLVQPSFLGDNNEKLLHVLRQYPTKYRGVIVLDNFSKINNIESLLESYACIGVRGIRLNLVGKELPYFEQETYINLFNVIIHLNWHIEIHADENQICKLLKKFKNYDLKIVLDHYARPEKSVYSNEFIDILKSNLNLHVKVSAPYRLKNRKVDNYVKTLLDTIGENNLLWGSDCPFTNHEESWDYKKSIDFINTNKLLCTIKSVFDENAQKMFVWDK